MKLKIQKEAIQNALQSIQGIVDKKTTMPILSHFLLKVNKTAAIMATDLDIALKGPLKAEVLQKGSLCIPAKKLFEIAREVEGEILLEAQDNNWIKVTSGKSTFKLMGLPESDFPALPEISKSEEITIKSGTIKDMIEKTIYATGESDTRYTLNGLLMHFVPKKKTNRFCTFTIWVFDRLFNTSSVKRSCQMMPDRNHIQNSGHVVARYGWEISLLLWRNFIFPYYKCRYSHTAFI